LDKEVDFIGRAALRRQQADGLRKRLLVFRLDDPDAFPWGGEPILMSGNSVGELTSAGYSRKNGCSLAMGYVRAERALTDDEWLAASYEIDIAGERFGATASFKLD
jgi:4-methylaminobutanoate oxidase (formaldehyde-forming)